LELPTEQFGHSRAEAGNWASCIGVYDTTVAPEVCLPVTYLFTTAKADQSGCLQSSLVTKVELEDNEAAFSITVVPFSSQNNKPYLIVGTAKETYLAPRACRQAYLHTYEISEDGRSLSLMHRTEVDDVPTALTAFNGRLLAGVGRCLRLYDLGRKKLLRKTENKVGTL
jgi:splicing factor 3B subunit 3